VLSLTRGATSSQDSYCVNTQFRYAKLKVKISSGGAEPTSISTTEVRGAVENDRKLFLNVRSELSEIACEYAHHTDDGGVCVCLVFQAMIVRIMKARKTLGHMQLVAEVLEQAAKYFHPDISHVKRSIEILIEQEYIRRDKSDAGVDQYVYLA